MAAFAVSALAVQGTAQLSELAAPCRTRVPLQPARAVRDATSSRGSALLAGSAAVLLTQGRRCITHRKMRKMMAPLKASTELDTSGPLPFVKLSRGTDEAIVYLRGASVSSYTTSGVEWLALRADAKLDGSKPNISGGLPICFPQFGPGDPLGRDVPPAEATGIPVHGLARNMDWKLVESESREGACLLELTDTEETRKLWPHEFRCLWLVELKDGELATKLTVENCSASECSFTCGLHSYFHVADIDKLKIKGEFSGTTMMHRREDPPKPMCCEKSELVISEFTDDIYKNVLPSSVVLDTGKGDLAIASASGWQHVVIWNPYGDEKLGYKNFVCVETVATDPISLAPKASWEASMSIAPQA